MLTRSLSIALAACLGAALALSFGPAQSGTTKGYGRQKVVYHVNYYGEERDKRYRAALANIQNHINAVGVDNIEVRVVLHGNGVALMKSAKTNDAIQKKLVSLKGQKVSFQLCGNTIRGRRIKLDQDLFEVTQDDIIPSGVAELARLQGQGFAYIKP